MLKQVIQDILGNLTLVNVIVAYIFAFSGLFLKWYFTASTAIKSNQTTPNSFSLIYWWQNNTHRLKAMLATIIIIFISIRFPMEFVGIPFGYFYALLVGLAFDWISEKIKERVNKPINFPTIPPAPQI